MLSGDLRQNHVGVGTRLVDASFTGLRDGLIKDISQLTGVVQGYRPQVDWGGDSGSATIVVGSHNVRVATSGWRRRCLYMLLLALLALSVINLSLTLWILKTVHFNVDGMGLLHVVTGGLQMEGTSELSKKMSAARFLSRKEEDLHINGYYNLTVHTAPSEDSLSVEDGEDASVANGTARHHLSNCDAYLHLNVDDIISSTKRFIVRDQSGTELFNADRHGTTVGAKTFTVTGFSGARLKGSLQTPRIYSRGVHELRLDSVTRDIKVRSKDQLRVEARNGDVSSISYGNAALVAKEGAIRFDNPDIFVPQLAIEGEDDVKGQVEEQSTPTQSPSETQIPPPPPSPPSATPPSPQAPPRGTRSTDGERVGYSEDVQVFQVCVCPSGKLFAVEATHACVPDDYVCW